MINYREILRLHSLGYSQRRIEASVRSLCHTVRGLLEKAKQHKISWPLDDDVTNADLDTLFNERVNSSTRKYAEPYDAYIHKELVRSGVTLTLLWNEYCERCYANGETPYMSTQFGDKYRCWTRITKATMRIQHKPGNEMQADWAGTTIPYFDSVTGAESVTYLFVYRR